MNLKEQLAQVVADGKKAVADGDIEKARELDASATALQERIALANKFGAYEPEPVKAVRPPMPSVGDDGPEANEPEQPSTVKAFYVKKFGALDSVVDTILKDVHGGDYAQKYWDQNVAFRKYVRFGDRALDSNGYKALRSQVLTPKSVAAALAQGFDSVDALKSTMVEASDTLGGYVVPVDFQADMIERLAAQTVIRPRADKVTTTRDRVEFPVSTGGGSQYPNNVTVTWVDETPTSTAAATNLTYGMESIPIHTVMASAVVSKNMLEDAAYPVEQHLSRSIAQAYAIDEDNLFLTGDGNGRPQGIIPGSANDLSLSYGYNSTSTNAAEWDGLVKTMYTIDAQYRQNAAWVGEKATYEAIAKLKDGEGQYLWRQQFGNNVGEGFQRALMGVPVLEQEGMPTIAANAFPMIFGDLSGYRIADRVGMTIERYDDSTTGRQNTVIFVARRRLGGQVVESWKMCLYKIATS